MYPLHHRLTKMSIPKAQSIGMTGFQRLCITATQAYFRGKMAQSLDTTGIEGIFLGYRGPGIQMLWEAVRRGGGALWGRGLGFKEAQSDSNNDFKTH